MEVNVDVNGCSLGMVIRHGEGNVFKFSSVLDLCGMDRSPAHYVNDWKWQNDGRLVRKDLVLGGVSREQKGTKHDSKFVTWQGVLYIVCKAVANKKTEKKAMKALSFLTEPRRLQFEDIRINGEDALKPKRKKRKVKHASIGINHASPVKLTEIAVEKLEEKPVYFDVLMTPNVPPPPNVEHPFVPPDAPMKVKKKMKKRKKTVKGFGGFETKGTSYGVIDKRRLIISEDELSNVLSKTRCSAFRCSGSVTTRFSEEGLGGVIYLQCDKSEAHEQSIRLDAVGEGRSARRLQVNFDYLFSSFLFSTHPAAFERVIEFMGLQIPNKGKISNIRSVIEEEIRKMCFEMFEEKIKIVIQKRKDRKDITIGYDAMWSRTQRKGSHAPWCGISFVDLDSGDIVWFELVKKGEFEEWQGVEEQQKKLKSGEHVGVVRGMMTLKEKCGFSTHSSKYVTFVHDHNKFNSSVVCQLIGEDADGMDFYHQEIKISKDVTKMNKKRKFGVDKVGERAISSRLSTFFRTISKHEPKEERYELWEQVPETLNLVGQKRKLVNALVDSYKGSMKKISRAKRSSNQPNENLHSSRNAFAIKSQPHLKTYAIKAYASILTWNVCENWASILYETVRNTLKS